MRKKAMALSLAAAKTFHISAVEKAGLSDLREGGNGAPGDTASADRNPYKTSTNRLTCYTNATTKSYHRSTAHGWQRAVPIADELKGLTEQPTKAHHQTVGVDGPHRQHFQSRLPRGPERSSI